MRVFMAVVLLLGLIVETLVYTPELQHLFERCVLTLTRRIRGFLILLMHYLKAGVRERKTVAGIE